MELETWLNAKLAEVLGFPSVDEITKYILSIDNVGEQESYLLEMLDASNVAHRNLVDELRSRRGGGSMRVYKKSEEEQDYVVGGGARPKMKKCRTSSAPGEAGAIAAEAGAIAAAESAEVGRPPAAEASAAAKKKTGRTKFVSLYSQSGAAKDIILLSGRHLCHCQASKHELINNCLGCGRIVCNQEGSGPCLFCGRLVCTKTEQDVLKRGSKKSEILRKQLTGVEGEDFVPIQKMLSTSEKNVAGDDGDAAAAADTEKAEMQKNKLLDFDKHCEKRTQVLDDESDYFCVSTSAASSPWLGPAEREAERRREAARREARHKPRLERRVTFDFAGRRIVDADDEAAAREENQAATDVVDRQIAAAKDAVSRSSVSDAGVGGGGVGGGGGGLFHPSIGRPRPVFTSNGCRAASSSPSDSSTELSGVIAAGGARRVQDRELQEMSDTGMCLSMHQPWASLLVSGVKLDEGRTWYSAHRGRLWIHSASKCPTEQEINELKQFYTHLRGDSVHFPMSYPTSCLLGCVDVQEVLPQEEYRNRFPSGESSSPYVFICGQPQELLLKYPMAGKHKLYKLDPNLHAAAKAAAKKSSHQS